MCTQVPVRSTYQSKNCPPLFDYFSTLKIDYNPMPGKYLTGKITFPTDFFFTSTIIWISQLLSNSSLLYITAVANNNLAMASL